MIKEKVRQKKIFKRTIAGNFQSWWKKIKIRLTHKHQEGINRKKAILRHIILKHLKNKDKVKSLKAAPKICYIKWKKWYEELQTAIEWWLKSAEFKTKTKTNCQYWILYSVKASFKKEGKISSYKQSPVEFVASRAVS